jgi:hypothetical protein
VKTTMGRDNSHHAECVAALSGSFEMLRKTVPVARAFVLALLWCVSACSVFLEASRPKREDPGTLRPGISRSTVITKLGPPVYSYISQGKTVDVYVLDSNGRYTLTKIGLTTFNLAADVFTIGMWEAVGTPLEKATRHQLTTYSATYSSAMDLESIEPEDFAHAPIVALKVDEEVVVQNIVAIHLEALNLSPDVVALTSPLALNKAGRSSSELASNEAIKLAGGPQSMTAALHKSPPIVMPGADLVETFIPGTQANLDSGFGFMGPPMVLIDPITAFVALSTDTIAEAIYPGAAAIRSARFFPDGINQAKLSVKGVRRGYAFFPKGDYAEIELSASITHGGVFFERTSNCKIGQAAEQ